MFALLRIDDFPHLREAPLEDRFYFKKVFLSEEAADEEAARLNTLNSDRGCRYVVHIARLEER